MKNVSEEVLAFRRRHILATERWPSHKKLHRLTVVINNQIIINPIQICLINDLAGDRNFDITCIELMSNFYIG